MRRVRAIMSFVIAGVTAISLSACSNESLSSGSSGNGVTGNSTTAAKTVATEASTDSGETVMRVAATRQPPSFDPKDSNTSVCEYTDYNIYETLLRFTNDGTDVEPDLAESWKQVDDKTYTYKLRDGVKFSDGNDMTMDDVLFSLNRVREKNYGMSYLFNSVDSFEGDSDTNTLTVHLKEPDSTWKYVPATATCEIVEKAVVEKEGDNYGAVGGVCIGTGPYMLESWHDNSEIIMKKNPLWWGDPDSLDIDRIEFYIMQDESTIQLAVQNGTIDFAPGISTDMVKSYQSMKGASILSVDGTASVFLALNTEVEPFDDVNARKAFAYCIDSDTLTKAVGGEYAKKLDSTLLPTSMKYQGPDEWKKAVEGMNDYGKQDIEKAKEYLAKSKYPNGFEVDLYAVPPTTGAELIQSMVKEANIGIVVNIVELQPSDLYNYEYGLNADENGHRPYQAYYSGWVSDYLDPVGYYKQLLHSSNKAQGGANQAMYANSDFDNLIDASYKTSDEKERLNDFINAAKIASDDCPYVPLYELNDLYVLSDKFTFSPSPQAFWNFSFRDFKLAGT